MTKVMEKSEIKNAINKYCELRGLSKNELATQIKVSGATLSKIENGDWESINEKMWFKIWNEVKPSEDTIFITPDFDAIVRGCDTMRKHHLMMGVTGDTGTGKTTALTTYAKRKNTYYIVFDKTMRPKHFFEALLREMGINFEGSINAMVNKIAEELNSQNEPLLIIDEAGKLTHTMMLYLHVIRDKTIKNCGFVLAGMPYFRNNLQRLSNKQKEGVAEFNRRINLWHELSGLRKTDILTICEHHGISDQETLKRLTRLKRFGDLINEITFLKIRELEINN
jgi:DNA transposition AAA+ family ATPase